jgi:hypothetical protein
MGISQNFGYWVGGDPHSTEDRDGNNTYFQLSKIVRSQKIILEKVRNLSDIPFREFGAGIISSTFQPLCSLTLMCEWLQLRSIKYY